jgi:hypothetical protein
MTNKPMPTPAMAQLLLALGSNRVLRCVPMCNGRVEFSRFVQRFRWSTCDAVIRRGWVDLAPGRCSHWQYVLNDAGRDALKRWRKFQRAYAARMGRAA